MANKIHTMEYDSVSDKDRPPPIGECVSRDNPMICRRFYPGDSACTFHGGKMRCLSIPQHPERGATPPKPDDGRIA